MVGDKHMILGIHVTNRMTKAGEVQKLLTEYGCNVKTRVGLHDVTETTCSPSGVILLELFGDETLCKELETKLAAIEGIEVESMVFGH